MKPKKLHIKIFLISILILVISELVVFFLFRATAINYIHTTSLDYLNYRAESFKSLIEEKLEKKQSDTNDNNLYIESLFNDMHRLYKAQICLLSPEGALLTCSDNQPVKVIAVNRLTPYNNFYYKNISEPDRELFYSHLPIQFSSGKTGAVIILFDRSKIRIVSAAEDLIFFFLCFCLAGIGFGVAVLLFPASRFITQPLRELRKSALRISDGDFVHRTEIETDDEIGDLGNAFNHLADTISQMIKGTKELTANISHELRSPLARIRIAEEIILDKLKNAGMDSQLPVTELDAIHLEIEEMDSLIGQILILSKLDTQKLSQSMKMVDMVQLLTDILERFAPAALRKSIHIKIDIPHELMRFFANTEDIRTIYSNLLDNALKYTPASGIVEISLSGNSEQLNFSISNSCNIEKDLNLDKIFQPFYRPVSNIEAGTGLGLAITKKIVGNYDGSIEAVQSEDGLMLRVTLKHQPV